MRTGRTQLAVAMLLFSVCPATAAEPNRVEQALDNAISVDFVEVPAKDAAEFLSDLVGVQFFLGAGVDEDTTLSIRAQKVKLREVLDAMLAKAGLEYIANETAITIVPAAKTPGDE